MCPEKPKEHDLAAGQVLTYKKKAGAEEGDVPSPPHNPSKKPPMYVDGKKKE